MKVTGLPDHVASARAEANELSVERMLAASPMLNDVRSAGEVLPGFEPNFILTSGAPMPWQEYEGGQRRAVIGAAVAEGMATSEAEVDARMASGEIVLGACHDHGAVGSVTGVYTASTPVLVVEETSSSMPGFCSVYEGSQSARLTYGVWNERVKDNLDQLKSLIGPTLGAVVRQAGGVDLGQIMRRGLRMGDDLHSRNTACTSLLVRDLAPCFLQVDGANAEEIETTLRFLTENDLFFLHVGMAAAKATADAAHGIDGSSVVTAMTMSEKEMSIRVSGLPGRWFRAPMPPFQGKYFEGFTSEDRADMGGESLIMETIGLGGMCSAAAFALSEYSGGSPAWMVENNEEMYSITVTENSRFRIPFLERGVPTGIDIFKVVESGITPTIHAGAGHRDGGHIGAGMYRAPLQCFAEAVDAYREIYG